MLQCRATRCKSVTVIGSALKSEEGVSLAELLIAVTIAGIVILGSVHAFRLISHGTQYSKARTLATNLGQEKIQILKQQSYNRLMVTTHTATYPDLTPAVLYDDGYYPLESILEGSIQFDRITYVQVAQEVSGEIATLAPTTPDTGMKLITATVVWSQGDEKKSIQMRNVASNPDMVMSNAIFSGTIRNASTLVPISNAAVNIAENVGWQDTSDAAGQYAINLAPGSTPTLYNLVASAYGYFTASSAQTIGPLQTITVNFNLAPMSSGTIKGSAWLNDHLVISQVVAGTQAASGYWQEYVEVFNPTTAAVTMNGEIGLRFQRPADSSKLAIAVTYVSPSVSSGGFYLFANTTTINAGGVAVAADAYWSAANSPTDFPYFSVQENIIPDADNQPGEGGGALELYRITGGVTQDIVGWDRNSGGQSAPFSETQGIDQNIGLQQGEQYVRFASTAGWSSVLGPAYDSYDNDRDFANLQPMQLPPRNSATAALPVVAGAPAFGAVASTADDLSSPAEAVSVGSPPYAEFTLTPVSTGTFVVYVTSGSLYGAVENVTVSASAVIWVPNGGTTPGCSTALCGVIASTEATQGFVAGRVTNAAGGVISPTISVSDGFQTVPSNAAGSYFLSMATGVYTVTANPNNLIANYISQSSMSVTVNLGQVASGVDFVLSQGGLISGYVTRDGLNALSGIGVTALDAVGSPRAEAVSGSDGRFLLVNLATGSYTVEPVLDSGETSSPTSANATVTAGATVSIGTFTIVGAFGTVAGSVQASGSPIKTGVLVVISTATITGLTPPALSAATLSGSPYYVGSSYEDGSYRVEVRGSTSTVFRAVAYYSAFSGETPVFSSRTVTGIAVTAGQTTSGVNFSW